MSHFVLAGFDKWCRISSGLSNAKIAAAISCNGAHYSEADVSGWRAGEGMIDPSATLLPLYVALKGPWPPATAEQAWQELLEVIAAGVPASEAPARKPTAVLEPTRLSPVRPRAAVAPPSDPLLDANKLEMESALEQVGLAANAAEQVQAGWFTRTSEKFKKYAASRDLKHRKAYLSYCLNRAETSLEKARAKRVELAGKLAALGSALATFDTMQQQNTERMQRKRDENVALWRELKAAAPQVATARQAFDKTSGKTLAGLDDVLKRAEAAVADWKTRHEAIAEPGQITLAWLTRDSKLGQRLQQVWLQNRVQTEAGWAWPENFDPFEGSCICKDKLADSYKVGLSHKQEKPVEIDLSAEIDLTVVGLEQRQKAAQAICQGST